MNCPLHELNKNSSLVIKLILATALMATASVSAAEGSKAKKSDVAYVDSVLKWGAWGLDIEPAAGGLSAPTTKPLNARNSKLILRTNSFSALAPPAASPSNPIERPGAPVPPPVIPPPTRPTMFPVGPGVPIPTGGPGNGSAPTPTITTISPNVPIPTGGPGVPTGGPGAS